MKERTNMKKTIFNFLLIYLLTAILSCQSQPVTIPPPTTKQPAPLPVINDSLFKGLPTHLIKWVLYSGNAGRLNTWGEKYPNSNTINYAFFGGKIYLHARKDRINLEEVKRNSKVTFVIDRFTDQLTLNTTKQGVWFSVNVFGTAKIIADPGLTAELANKYAIAVNTTPDKVEESVAAAELDSQTKEMMKTIANRMVIVEITPALITAKLNGEKLNLPKLPYTLDGTLFKPLTQEEEQSTAGLAQATYQPVSDLPRSGKPNTKLSLPPAQIDHILHSSSVGRIVTFGPVPMLSGEEYPYSVPVSFSYFEGKIALHGRAIGMKMDNIKNNPNVTFTVDRYNEKEGWVSINIFGEVEIIQDPVKKMETLMKYGTAYISPAAEIEPKVAEIKGPFQPMNMPLTLLVIHPKEITHRVSPVPAGMMTKQPYISDATQVPKPDLPKTEGPHSK